ncbi:MAG: Gfo/Idh/MocA family oxidoreductase [Henriciella sp.]|uniref:Gfo/Idh/MocA family protein n=1 Tax=Henriciella sp. TaxID=1968823 RepID=UPI003C761852
MTNFQANRRGALAFLAGASALPLVGACANAQAAEDGSSPSGSAPAPEAVGQPMPGNVELPDTPPEKPSGDSVGYAVVGLGGDALNPLMPSISGARRSHIAALVSGNRGKCETVAKAYGVPADACYSYDNFDEIASDDRIDAVYIVLPSGLHAEYVERAFAAGKHVLCEKPMALSSTECERMIAASKAANRKLMIAYRCHFEPHNLKAMELMRDKAVGDIRLIRANQQYRMGPTTPKKNWRVDRSLAGYGPLEDYGIYGLQSALYLSGEMPATIAARMVQPTGDSRFAEIASSVSTLIKFPSGAMAELYTSYDTRSANRGVVYGTSGVLEMDPATGYGGHQYTLRTDGVQQIEAGDPSVQFAAQFDHLADAIRDGADIRTPGEMGLRDVRLMEAIFKSALTDSVIHINPDGTIRS